MNDTLSILTGKSIENPRTVLERGFYGVSTDTANCLIKTNNVNCICDSTVLAVGQSPRTNEWCVTTEVGPSRWVRYCGLSSTGVTTGMKLNKKDFIGYSTNGYMRLEYCTKLESNYPVRLLGIQLYKNDPTPIIFTKRNIADM